MKTKHKQSKTIGFIVQSIARLGMLILVFNTSVAFGQSGSCSANLKVEKDRNTRSTPLDGTYYSMVITNTSGASSVFLITPNDSDMADKPINGGNTSIPKLQASILDSDLNPIDRISLSSGQSVNFLVHISVPSGIAYSRTYDTTIVAKSLSCSNYSTNTVLHTFVMNPNED